MKHIAKTFQTVKELKNFLQENKEKIESAHSILAQVFVSKVETAWIRHLCKTIKGFSEKIIIIGATTAGEICDGRNHINSNVVSLSFFEATRITPIAIPIQPGDEQASAKTFVGKLQSLSPEIKGVLLFLTPVSVNCNILLKTIYDLSPHLPLIGGGAGDYGRIVRSFVFSDHEIFEYGLVAVALTGDTLHVSRHAFLGWRPIGKVMKVTKAHGLVVKEIDNNPAFNVIQKYLGIETDENLLFNLLEFPFLVKRGDHLLARTPVAATKDGSVIFSTDINEGETLQFGYGDIDLIFDQSRIIHHEIEQFAPEAIFLYSCITRRFILQEDVDLELQPYEAIAPSAGFFTQGEFCDLGDMSPHLNTTIVVAALREGDRKPRSEPDHKQGTTIEQRDPFHRRHTRIMSRFHYLLEAVTDELSQANTELKKKLEEIKILRGILPICASCKRIRDDGGYWNQLESYIRAHSDAEFSHSICPDCARKLYPELSPEIIDQLGKSENK